MRIVYWQNCWTAVHSTADTDRAAFCFDFVSCRSLALKVIEAILDDDNDMQDMYLGRRAAAEALAQQQVSFQASSIVITHCMLN